MRKIKRIVTVGVTEIDTYPYLVSLNKRVANKKLLTKIIKETLKRLNLDTSRDCKLVPLSALLKMSKRTYIVTVEIEITEE